MALNTTYNNLNLNQTQTELLMDCNSELINWNNQIINCTSSHPRVIAECQCTQTNLDTIKSIQEKCQVVLDMAASDLSNSSFSSNFTNSPYENATAVGLLLIATCRYDIFLDDYSKKFNFGTINSLLELQV